MGSTNRLDRRMRAKELADEKMREGWAWAQSFERALSHWRRYQLIHAALETAYEKLVASSSTGGPMWRLVMSQLDWAHDMMWVARENMDTCANCSVSAEIAARIYYEEYEERQHDQK